MSDTIEARFTTVLNTNERLKRELSAAKAEILRLRKVLVLLEDAIEEALADPKPDTGEQLIAELHVSGTKEEWLAALAANREDAALKPDTGE